MDTTITSANSVFTLTVPGLYPTPVTLQGYSTDSAFTSDVWVASEAQMGVDGRMTAGWTPTPFSQTIHLQADSPSRVIFTTIVQTIYQQREIFYMQGSVTLPSTREVFTLNKGVITNSKAFPDAAKVLQPVQVLITWESVKKAAM